MLKPSTVVEYAKPLPLMRRRVVRMGIYVVTALLAIPLISASLPSIRGLWWAHRLRSSSDELPSHQVVFVTGPSATQFLKNRISFEPMLSVAESNKIAVQPSAPSAG